jgi:hypothetical protein
VQCLGAAPAPGGNMFDADVGLICGGGTVVVVVVVDLRNKKFKEILKTSFLRVININSVSDIF